MKDEWCNADLDACEAADFATIFENLGQVK